MNPQDEALLRRLGDVFDQVDPPPALTVQAARAALELRDLDAELLPLVEQSQLTAVRGGSRHAFTFAVEGVEIELAASRDRFGWALVGQLVPAGDPAAGRGGDVAGPVTRSITVQTLTSRDTVPLDELGRFRAVVAAGPVMLRLVAAQRALRTDWVSL